MSASGAGGARAVTAARGSASRCLRDAEPGGNGGLDRWSRRGLAFRLPSAAAGKRWRSSAALGEGRRAAPLGDRSSDASAWSRAGDGTWRLNFSGLLGAMSEAVDNWRSALDCVSPPLFLPPLLPAPFLLLPPPPPPPRRSCWFISWELFGSTKTSAADVADGRLAVASSAQVLSLVPPFPLPPVLRFAASFPPAARPLPPSPGRISCLGLLSASLDSILTSSEYPAKLFRLASVCVAGCVGCVPHSSPRRPRIPLPPPLPASASARAASAAARCSPARTMSAFAGCITRRCGPQAPAPPGDEAVSSGAGWRCRSTAKVAGKICTEGN